MTNYEQDISAKIATAPPKKPIPDVGPGVEELMHVHPAPDHPEGIEVHPEFDALGGPTEASDNHDNLTQPSEREMGGRF